MPPWGMRNNVGQVRLFFTSATFRSFGGAGLAPAYKYVPERVTIGTLNHYIYLRVVM